MVYQPKKRRYTMGFYDLSKEERAELVEKMKQEIIGDLSNNSMNNVIKYVSDEDNYIRKNAYLILGRNYRDSEKYRDAILTLLKKLSTHKNELVRQTIINGAGEIGKYFAEDILDLMERAMKDEHFKVRNAVIGSLKKMSQKNPEPTIKFAEQFLHHPDPEVRRQVVHGVELRGRTHPEDVLPLLKKVQDENKKRVREIIIHVIGQISYKKGCLIKVIEELKTWHNKRLVQDALEEIKEVHGNYKFSKYSTEKFLKVLKKKF